MNKCGTFFGVCSSSCRFGVWLFGAVVGGFFVYVGNRAAGRGTISSSSSCGCCGGGGDVGDGIGNGVFGVRFAESDETKFRIGWAVCYSCCWLRV